MHIVSKKNVSTHIDEIYLRSLVILDLYAYIHTY